MDVNDYLTRSYPGKLPCWLLVRDVMQDVEGRTVSEYRTVNNSVRALAKVFGEAVRKNVDGLQQITEPRDMAVVLMGKSSRTGIHHAGVYWQGSVLHALEDGVYFQDMASLRDAYGVVEFWA